MLRPRATLGLVVVVKVVVGSDWDQGRKDCCLLKLNHESMNQTHRLAYANSLPYLAPCLHPCQPFRIQANIKKNQTAFKGGET